jgi:MYXO-CTERM domain-containing protein
MKRCGLVAGVVLTSLLVTGGQAFGQNNPLISVDEFGHGSLLFPGGAPIPTVGVLAPDPGPGGLAAAMTYNLLGPPGLVAGDVFLLEPGASNVISDIIRFNPAGTGSPGYPASLVFYSDNVDTGEVPAPADTGFPTAFYTNQFITREVASGGEHTATYTPTANQPGFVPGFGVTYFIVSSVPEPGPMVLGGLVALAGLGTAWARRKRPTA